MTSTYLEQLRSTVSSVEVVEKTIVYCLFGRNTNPQHAVLLEHRVNNLLQMCQKQAADALVLIDGADGWKKEEMDILQGVGRREGDVWDSFYDRLKEIKDYHRKISQGHTLPQVSTNKVNYHLVQIISKVEYFFDQAFEPPYKEPYFSGEEGNGRYLDLHSCYQEFLNLKKLKESEEYKFGDYLWYLQNFDLFHEIPQHLKEKEGKKYKHYLTSVFEYLKNLYQRVNPLTNIKKVQDSFEMDFERQWKSGVIRGWEKPLQSQQEITSNPLYCLVCTKLFQNENTFIHHFQGKKHKKLAKIKEKGIPLDTQNKTNGDVEEDEENVDTTLKERKKYSYLETMICNYKENLCALVQDTMNLVRKKQSRSYDDMDADMDGNEGEAKKDDQSEDESPIYNPKNLPLGWDGRPIPYWLYKLHGLGVEYKCEICGNTSYWGRKAFEDHFQGWRHSYGMRCLRIPNTLHFKEITKIQDAINLFQRIQIETEHTKFRPDYEEEYEDTEGNLLNKKTFYDLKKQGLE